jgi:hypothetical protein
MIHEQCRMRCGIGGGVSPIVGSAKEGSLLLRIAAE